MDRRDVSWHGYWPAAPTPFSDDGRLDVRALTALIELYVAQGVHGVLVNGSTGEWFSQSMAERRRVADVAVAAAAQRIPVVVGVTAYTVNEAAELGNHAALSGADGILATPPPYVHPGSDEIYAHFRDLGHRVDLPLMVYNWPRGVTVDIGQMPGLWERLAELPSVVAVKDSTGDWLAMVETVERLAGSVRVFGSFLSRRGLAVLRGLGGDGNIDGGGLGAPFAVPFYQAVEGGDFAAAALWADRYRGLSGRLINPDYSGIFASPVPQLKAIMSLLGQPSGTVRPPLLPVSDPAVRQLLREVIIESGIAEALAAGS